MKEGTTRHTPFLLYGILLFCLGIAIYLVGVLLVIPRYLLDLHALLDPVSLWLVWYSGMPIMLGLALALFDLLYLFGHKKPDRPVRFVLVERVIVVSNNSADRTMERAEAAGAIVFNELAPGYGRCVFRCLSEAVEFADTEFVVLCEGDSTFRAYDIEKLLAYAPHADIVNGTRTVEPLRQYLTQLSTFMYYGNIFVGKLLEAKHLGRGTITDVGTTYKLCRRDALVPLLQELIFSTPPWPMIWSCWNAPLPSIRA